MKSKMTLILFLIFVSIALHAYLTSHYYPLHFGLSSSSSVCNIGESFNCDAVAASSYSNFLNIPLSVWGLALHGLLLVMVFIFLFGLSDHPSAWKRWSLYVGGVSSAASLVMAILSLQLTTYCLFCIILYFLSFGIFFLLWKIQEEPIGPGLGEDVGHLFGKSKWLTVCIIAIPISAFIIHASIMKNYSAGEIQKVVNAVIQDWKTTPKVEFTAAPVFTLGAPESEAKLVLAEFVDFRCGHCKDAAPSIHSFVKANLKDVHFKFYTFPLDGECNSEMRGGGDGVSCRIAKGALCSEKQGKGLAVHDELFEAQNKLVRLATPSQVDEELQKIALKTGISFEELVNCMNESSTQDHIEAQVQQARLGGLRGTPTIFANSRKLERGQLIPVLNAALQNASEVSK